MSPPGRCRLPDGRALTFDDVGDPAGVPVVYLHGSPDSRLARHPDDGLAAAAGVRLLAVDRPGSGGSDADPAATLGSVADDLAGLLDHLGLDRVGVVGWSVGGLQALAAGARHPDRFAGVGAAAAIPPVGAFDDPAVLAACPPDRRLLVDAARAGDDVAALAAQLAPMLVPAPLDRPLALDHLREGSDHRRRADLDAVPGAWDRLADALVEAVRGGHTGVARDLVVQATTPDVDPTDCAVPVTLWYGADDPVAPPAFGHWWATRLRAARLEVVPSVGHAVALTRWPEILRAVAADLVAAPHPGGRA